MDFNTFMCAVILGEHNLNMISWNAYGEDFHEIKRLVEPVKNSLHSIIYWRSDDALGIDFLYPSYSEVIDILSEANEDFFTLDASRKFTDKHEVMDICYKILNNIKNCIKELKDSEGPVEFFIKQCCGEVLFQYNIITRMLDGDCRCPVNEPNVAVVDEPHNFDDFEWDDDHDDDLDFDINDDDFDTDDDENDLDDIEVPDLDLDIEIPPAEEPEPFGEPINED